MDPRKRIKQSLATALDACVSGGSPPKFAAAVRHAVLAGGARVRPRLCLAVAAACGEDDPALTAAAGSAIELLHCASLVHDDLPCFDDAAMRRGQPSVHKTFGEPLAVLAGDALIVLAFQHVTRHATNQPGRLPGLIGILGQAAGAPSGIAAGQAWECEPTVDLSLYQRAKTGALFAAATMAGAASAGAEAAPWECLGLKIGEAYQVADDIHDVASQPAHIGKPAGRDAALDRPSAARQLGLPMAIDRFGLLVDEAVESIPDCPGAGALKSHMLAEAKLFLPEELRRRAA